MPWKITVELLALAPFVTLFLAAFAFETRQAVATARALRPRFTVAGCDRDPVATARASRRGRK